MSVRVPQIIGNATVWSTGYLCEHQRDQSLRYWPFVRENQLSRLPTAFSTTMDVVGERGLRDFWTSGCLSRLQQTTNTQSYIT